jgi:hypothetical protein
MAANIHFRFEVKWTCKLDQCSEFILRQLPLMPFVSHRLVSRHAVLSPFTSAILIKLLLT